MQSTCWYCIWCAPPDRNTDIGETTYAWGQSNVSPLRVYRSPSGTMVSDIIFTGHLYLQSYIRPADSGTSSRPSTQFHLSNYTEFGPYCVLHIRDFLMSNRNQISKKKNQSRHVIIRWGTYDLSHAVRFFDCSPAFYMSGTWKVKAIMPLTFVPRVEAVETNCSRTVQPRFD